MIKDGGWTLVEYDYQTGRCVWGYYDGAKQHYRIDYPVEGMIRENEALRNMAASGWKGDYHLIASVPHSILYDENTGLSKAFDQGDDTYVSRWLNDLDNRAWRTKEGTV